MYMENVILDKQAQLFNTSRSSNKVKLITAGMKALVCQHSGDSQFDSLR